MVFSFFPVSNPTPQPLQLCVNAMKSDASPLPQMFKRKFVEKRHLTDFHILISTKIIKSRWGVPEIEK